MKTITLMSIFLLSSIASAQKFPIENAYSPTYQDVVVLYEIADEEFMPSFFHRIMGEYLLMSKHESCQKIKVVNTKPDNSVVCVSSKNQEVVVGVLGETIESKGFYRAHKVIWNPKAELTQTVSPKGTLSYSIAVKSQEGASAAELNCVQNGEDGKPWLTYRADIGSNSDLLNIDVHLAYDNTPLSSRNTPSTGVATDSKLGENSKWYGYVSHSNIAHFFHPGSQIEFEVDLVIPGNVKALKGKSFSSYSEMRMPADKSSNLWGVSCSVK